MRVSAQEGGSGHVNLPSHFGWLVQAHVYKYSAYYQHLREANQNEQLDSFQRDLSYIGVFPVVGNAVNVVNGVISLYRGNYVDAAVNFVSALPVVGTAFRGAKLAVKGGGKFLKFGGDEAVVHFGKHGKSVMDALGKTSYNLKNYVDDANFIIKNGAFISELNGYVRFIGGQGNAKFGFVGLNRTTGYITTFHIKTAQELAKKASGMFGY